MKILLAQLNPTIGDLKGNAVKVRETVTTGKRRGCDLVVFPELFLSGYPPKDLLYSLEFLEAHKETLKKLVDEDFGVDILLGAIVEDQAIYNACVHFGFGDAIHVVPKVLLPTYDVFDEQRYFASGMEPQVVEIKGIKFGVSICEDLWTIPELMNPFIGDPFLYERNIPYELSELGADWILNISASPFWQGKQQTRMKLLQCHAEDMKRPIVFVNQVGAQDELVFDGSSAVVWPDKVEIGPSFCESLMVLDTETSCLACSGDNHFVGEISQLSKPAEDEGELKFQALCLSVRDYFHKQGFEKAIIGLSGGMDSALVAVIAVHALGRKNVDLVYMPSEYSADLSLKLAKDLTARLDVPLQVIPIQNLFEDFKNALAESFADTQEDVTEENIQARIRGTILMALANKSSALVLSTGNKSELAMGYCTLYGDMNGGFSVIADVYKTQVYELAKILNKKVKLIPEKIISRVPTAELKANQTDQDVLPPYEVLDKVLFEYLEQHTIRDSTDKFGAELVERITKTVDQMEFKRLQAAMCPKVTTRAFGQGRRFPVVQKFSK